MTTAPQPPLHTDGFPHPDEITADLLLERFLEYTEAEGLELYPAQEEAILELAAENNVILNTPTGSGKSLVAMAACFVALAYGEKAYYTAPIKALVSEKFLSLCKVFGAKNVGMMTGDASVNSTAPIICCTAEILANRALSEGKRADVRWVVMDEFHYYSDRDRGVAWQVPLLTLPQCRFLLMSATLGETELFERKIKELTGAETKLVKSTERPVPLDFSYSENPIHETITDLLDAGKAPIYVVHFSQRAASEQAQKLTSINFLDKAQKLELKAELKHFRFDSPFGKELSRFVPHGIGVHHAGMLPKYRLLVEKLAQKGLLKLICGTDTLGVGVNIPLRTVLFTQLCKYDGKNTRVLSVRDFQQISGRAGRRGFDTQGSVVVQAPEHVIENLSSKRKAAGDAKKLKKLRPKKAPERGYAPWDEKTLEKLRTSAPEALVSRFSVGSGMLLNVLSRKEENGCHAMKNLVRDSFESRRQKFRLGRSAYSLLRALVDADIIVLDNDGAHGHGELQEDFSLNHALSLYAVEVIDSLEMESLDYPLTVLTLVEAIVETPGVIVKKQLDKLKTVTVAELKREGVEFDERMEILDQLRAPQPEKELLWSTFDAFAAHHPWVMGNKIGPKSIARDMYEQGLSFHGYIREYGLERAEGVLLRYLSEVYRVLEHTVVDAAKNEVLIDLIEWLAAELKSADASLLEEWNRLAHPELINEDPVEPDPGEQDITRDKKEFTRLIRNQVFRLVQTLARQDYEAASRTITQMAEVDRNWTPELISDALAPYFEEYAEMRTDPKARGAQFFSLTTEDERWVVRQTLADPEEEGAYQLVLEVNLSLSNERGFPVTKLLAIEKD